MTATTDDPPETAADTVVVGVFEGKDVSHDLEGAPLQALLDSGEAKRAFKRLADTHAASKRWILVGLGSRDAFDAERAVVAAAVALGRAQELGTRVLCWELPHKVGDGVIEGVVQGTVMAAYRYDAYNTAAAD